MNEQQALSVLSGLINSPVVKLSLGITELGACDLALRTLGDALKAKPEAPANGGPMNPEPTAA